MSGSSKRLEWVKMKIAQAFPAAGEDAINDCIQASQKKIDAFFEDLKSPPKLLFFYQQRQFKKEELYMSLVGDGEKLAGKCCWFLRNSNKPIKTNIANDNTVLSGEIHSLLQSLESTISNVYKPCLEKSEKWGSITREDDKQVFLDHVEKFDVELKKTIENLTGDVTLAVPQEPYDKIEQKPAAYARAAKESNVLAHFVEILQSWCKNIKAYMDNDPSNIPISPTCSDGPEIEIDYWARRMLTLISITEQLKSKQARVVTGVVKARALRSDDDGAQTPEAATEQQEMKDHIEAWREVDLAITDSLN
jgi:dynein heavy chain